MVNERYQGFFPRVTEAQKAAHENGIPLDNVIQLFRWERVAAGEVVVHPNNEDTELED